MNKGNGKRFSTIGLAAVITISTNLFSACGNSTPKAEVKQPVTIELTDNQISKILPEFDLDNLELKSTQKNFRLEQTDEIIPVIINYQGLPSAETPRQCLGGENAISRSFEGALLSAGWTIDSLLTGDYAATLASSSSIMSIEVFRKFDYVLVLDCRIQISDVEEQQVEGSWGSVTTKRSCIVNNGPQAQIILSFKSVPKIIMGMAGQTMTWDTTSLADVEPIFLDDAWRLFATRENAYVEPIIDYEGIPYSYRDEYPKTPNDTNHGPKRACRFDEQSSSWIIPS